MHLSTVIPQPSRVAPGAGVWRWRYRSHWSRGHLLRIATGASARLEPQAELLAGYLREENLAAAALVPGEEGDIVLTLSSAGPGPMPAALAEAGFEPEWHRIHVEPERIRVEAGAPAGIARAVQTLRQLLSGQRARLELPCGRIEDAPALGWRGLHLDVARHFRTAAEVRRYIDLAALHKLNLFHWHLTDDQGWRLPVEGYPRIEEIAAWREGTLVGHDCDRATSPIDGIPHGGCYTAEEIRETVAYAAARGVQVLPEVDVPGHVQALVTAYPEFGNTGRPPGVRTCWGISDTTLNLEPGTFAFLERVVETLAGLFPFRYLHFGGDEARTGEWAASERIQERKRELGLCEDREVQHHFTRELQRFAARHGRRMIGWDEIVEAGPLPEGAAVMYWRDSDSEEGLDVQALRAGAPVVLANCSRTYFDHYQKAGEGMDFEPLAICGNLPIEKVYAWEPLERYPAELQPGVLGAQAQAWTEYIPTRAHLDYMVYPRACALAQVLWTGPAREGWADFERRLESHLPRLDRLGVAYRPRLPLP